MDEQPSVSFGPRLARLRQAAGLSQQALADRLSVTRQAVSNWEREQTVPDLDMLLSLARELGVDMNALCGLAPAPAPAPRSRRRVPLLSALCLCLCAALCLSALWRAVPPAPEEPEASPAALSLPPHRVRYTTPSGITCITAADGAEELSALLEDLSGGEPGPVERTAALWDTFDYFAGQYELRFLPAFRDGAFLSDWEQLLLWLYRAGTSGGGLLTTEQVDASIAQFFGAVSYRHQGTERFPLTEEGYRPDCGGYSGGEYALRSLVLRPDGSFEALVEEHGQDLEISLVLSPQDGSLRFHEVEIAQAQ